MLVTDKGKPYGTNNFEFKPIIVYKVSKST